MKKLLFAMVGLLAFLSFHPVWADKTSNLYEVELPVATQTEDVRSDAMKEGLFQVLVKISGDPQIDKNPLIKASIKKAEYYVQEFSYAPPSTSSSTYTIRIRYEMNDVDKLLKKAGVTTWGVARPQILVWVAVTNGDKATEIVGDDVQGDILADIKQQGQKFGLPLIFPVLDVTDIDLVSPADVVDMKISVLEEAGKRYATDAMLVGSMQQGVSGWESEWQLIWKNNKWDWKIAEKTPDAVFLNLFNQVNQSLSKHLTGKSEKLDASAPVTLNIEVANILEGDDLSQLMQFLKQLKPVQEVKIAEEEGNVVALSVLVRGNISSFQQNASIGQHLVLKSQDVANNKLIYEWVR